ncbi:sodium/glutamate symporter [Pseudoalteromonas ulvae]|uniref:sodium/glutamate symporter n=1 Tax=Pseudoalteromonas ulvae TaxID=107327 RepID=UPI001D039673|nr:sodium/glutamate symporter [Pseudoalteromonas ulvae]
MLELSQRQTIIIAIFVLFLGKFLNKHISFLKEFNIPEPVTGGMVASLITGALYLMFDYVVEFELNARDQFLLIFFTTIGLSARFTSLKQGGRGLLILLVLAIIYLVLQNLTGIAVSQFTGLPSAAGVLGGSVSLSGGHGTAIAWAPIFSSRYGIENAMEIGIACATFGLVLGGVLGGPIAQFLIKRHQLSGQQASAVAISGDYSQGEKISVETILNCVLVISIAIGLGLQLNRLLASLGLALPEFVTALFAGIVLTNSVPMMIKSINWPTGTHSLNLISDVSLGLFLAMSLMSLQLWTLTALAGPILVLLFAQVVVITLFVMFVVFRLMGKDYDAAVIASGYIGLGLGATPTAIANMNAVTDKFGVSAKAFIIVPLVGAFFIDIANALIIQFMLNQM